MQTAPRKDASHRVIRTVAREKEGGATFNWGTDGATCLAVGDFSRETRKFPASGKLGEPTRSLRGGRYDDLLPRDQILTTLGSPVTRREHHCAAKVGEDTAGPTRWWEYTCTTVLHENSYPPWQGKALAGRQAGST